MTNRYEHAAEHEWAVFTMTHGDELFDEMGQPVDDCDVAEWMVGWNVRLGSDEWHAVSASVVASGMTYSMAVAIAGAHNATLADPDRATTRAWLEGYVAATKVQQGVVAGSPGAAAIAAERVRHTEVEGWTPEHDALHSRGEMLEAARQYTDAAYFIVHTGREDGARFFHGFPPEPARWPWHPTWWKPTWGDPVPMLVKAGSLIAAEIDRLQALAAEFNADAAEAAAP